jgi:hypothetical protein
VAGVVEPLGPHVGPVSPSAPQEAAAEESARSAVGGWGVRGVCAGSAVPAMNATSADRGDPWGNVVAPSTALVMRKVAMAFTVSPGRRAGRSRWVRAESPLA